MTKLEIAKNIIRKYYSVADAGLFDCRNWCGDDMYTVYDDNGLTIDICYNYSYFEVFGLSDFEFSELETFYDSLKRRG